MLFSILLHPLRIGWDPALHLQCAQLIVAGGLPYVDMFDVNPPLIWYLDTLPAVAANFFNQPVTLTFNLFMVLIMVISASLSAYIAVVKLRQNEIIVNLALLFGLLYFNFFLTFDFGQREQLFVLLYLPFIFLRSARYQNAVIGKGEAILIGVMASIGICLKHYFLFNAICIELFLLLSCGNFRSALRTKLFVPETWSAVLFALIYLAHFLFLPQIVKENYFGFLVPAFARGYQFWDISLAASLAAPERRNVFLLLSLGIILSLAFCRRYQTMACVAAFALSSVVPYLMQFKGWNYQDIPAFAGAVMLLSGGAAACFCKVAASLQLKSETEKKLCFSAIFVLACASIVSAHEEYKTIKSEPNFPLERIGYSGNSPMSDIASPFTDIILDHAKTFDSVIFISNAVAPAFPTVTQLRMKPGSRHLHCCILSVLRYIKDVRETTPETIRLLAYQDKIVSQYAEDIAKNKPILIFMQNAPSAEYLAPYNFNQYLKNYKKIESDIAGFSAYERQK